MKSIMRMIIVFLLMTGSVMAQSITYTAKKEPVAKAISVIKQQTGYSVMYNPDLFAPNTTVTVDAKNMPLKEYLDKIIADNPLSYTIENKTIFIKHDHSKMKADGGGFKMTRIYNIKGKVVNENGAPLNMVSVAVGDSPYGGTTDKDGIFNLHDVPEGRLLTFTYMGYKKLSVPVASVAGKAGATDGVSASVVDPSNLFAVVTLQPDVKALEEIAVANTGYQLVPREKAAASQVTVSEKELNTQLNTNLNSALEGKVAGLSFYRNQPAIRGTNTFIGGAAETPLLVIDGMITEGALSDVNPYDIESVTVLKDAAASSIYGARAANGVIVLTTKKGRKGAGVRITANADHFITTKPDLNKMHYATTSQLMDYETRRYNYDLSKYNGNTTDLFNSYSTTSYYSPLYALYQNVANGTVSQDSADNTLAQWRNNDYIRDYARYVWKNEVKQRYNISLSNATDKTNTFISVNYEGNQDRIKNNTDDMIALYFKNSMALNKWLSVTVGLNGRYTMTTSTDASYNTYDIQPRYASVTGTADYVKLTDGYSTSDYVNANVINKIAGNKEFKSFSFNVLDELNNGLNKQQNLWLRTFTDVDIRFSKHLKYSAKLQYEMSRSEARKQDAEDSYTMRYLYNAMTSYTAATDKYTHNLPTGDRLYQSNARARNFTFRQQVDYNTDFRVAGKPTNLTAFAGMETRELYAPADNISLTYGYNPVTLGYSLVDYKTLNQTGITSYLFGNTTLGYAPGVYKTETRHRYVSFYGNFGYSFNSTYNLTGSVRVDQTDLFGTDPKYRYRPLWSIGGSWNATNEAFMKDLNWLNYLKVRATYGIGGNVDQSSSPFLRATLKNDQLYPALQYTNISSPPNPKLRWEQTATLNFGLDYTILNNILNGSIDYYRKHSSDLLATADLDPTVGYLSQRINNGAMSNRGIEVMFNSTWLSKKDFYVTSRLTLAYNQNKIEKATSEVKDAYSMVSAPNNYYFPGTPTNALYAYKYAGMTNGYTYFYDETGKTNVTFDANNTPTNVTLLNKPGVLKLMGTTTPKYSAFFQQMVGYKGFELTANLAYYGGHKMRKDVISLSGYDQTDESLTRSYSDNNQNTDIPRLQMDYPTTIQSYASTLGSYYAYSDIHVVSAASMRLRNVALSYSLPRKYCNLLHVKSIRLTAQANNLWLWTANDDDIDPETFSLNSGFRNLPTPKSYLFGASLSF